MDGHERVDLEIIRSGELDVAHVEGQTDAGVEFVDAYLPADSRARVVVVDSGRIIVPSDDLDFLNAAAERAGLSIETTLVV